VTHWWLWAGSAPGGRFCPENTAAQAGKYLLNQHKYLKMLGYFLASGGTELAGGGAVKSITSRNRSCAPPALVTVLPS
jgi:hypothetical protein